MAITRFADGSRARSTLPVRREPGVAAALVPAAALRTMPPRRPSTAHGEGGCSPEAVGKQRQGVAQHPDRIALGAMTGHNLVIESRDSVGVRDTSGTPHPISHDLRRSK